MNVESMSKWLPVHATLLEWQRFSRRLKELEVSFDIDEESHEQFGEAMWGIPFRGALVGLGWRWRELSCNFVAIDNPMEISSNVVLLDENGHEVPPSKRILHLNNAIYRLEWLRPVVDGMKARRHPLAA